MDISSNTYNCSYVEVLEILNHIPKIEYEKIPKSIISFFEKNKDLNYTYKYDEKNPKTLKNTDAIIIYLYKDYIANDEEKKEINEILQQNYIKSEKIKREKYPVDIFKNNTIQIKPKPNNCIEENKIIKYDNSFFTKILNILKKIIKGIK